MKRILLAVALAAVFAAASLTACTSRQDPNKNKEKNNLQENQPPAQEEEEPVLPQEPQKEQPVKPEEEGEQPQPEEGGESRTPANPTAVIEFGQYTSLDPTKKGWGPGGPVDELNRSQGALAYQELYGKYNADFIGENKKQICLTFDEGYENGFTDDILDVLKEKQVPAVFFVTQPYVETEGELIRRMINEGHIVGNHSVNHPSFPDTPLAQCKEEIQGLHNYVKENFDYEMNLFRFPMGEFNEQDLKLVQDMGYRSVFWSFAYRDWEVDNQPDPSQALTSVVEKAHPGAIYLLHAVSQTNAEILGDFIDSMRAQGYEFISYPDTSL